PFEPAAVAKQVRRLAPGEGRQQTPEIIAVVQLGNAPALSGAAETVKGTEGDVFFVGSTARGTYQPGTGQRNQPFKIAVPEGIGRCLIPGAKLRDPLSY